MRRIRHERSNLSVENCKRSSRGYTDQFWFGGPMLALIATLTPNLPTFPLQLSRGATCRRIRYRRFSQPGGLWAYCSLPPEFNALLIDQGPKQFASSWQLRASVKSS
jgi:hypothetical protein